MAAAGNHAGGEPVLFLAFIEHDLERSDAERNQGEADVVDARLRLADALLFALQVGRIFHHPLSEKQRKNANRDVDEEDPVPAVVIGNPTADGRADGRRDHHRHAVYGEAQAALVRRESIGENGLLAGRESTSAGALQDAEEYQQAAGWARGRTEMN